MSSVSVISSTISEIPVNTLVLLEEQLTCETKSETAADAASQDSLSANADGKKSPITTLCRLLGCDHHYSCKLRSSSHKENTPVDSYSHSIRIHMKYQGAWTSPPSLLSNHNGHASDNHNSLSTPSSNPPSTPPDDHDLLTPPYTEEDLKSHNWGTFPEPVIRVPTPIPGGRRTSTTTQSHAASHIYTLAELFTIKAQMNGIKAEREPPVTVKEGQLKYTRYRRRTWSSPKLPPRPRRPLYFRSQPYQYPLAKIHEPGTIYGWNQGRKD